MGRPKKPAARPAGTSEPFFARYLEGQERGPGSSAEIGERKSLAYKKAIKPPPLMTLKFPSDSDELHYKPYYQSKADVPKQPGGGVVTLKFPSDSDEDIYHAEYTSKTDVPKGKAIKKGASIKLKKAK
jgi:hypothetical protein